MDPKHRDRVAFLRIVSGKFERGMKVRVERTGKALALTRPQKMFAQVRTATPSITANPVAGHFSPQVTSRRERTSAGPRLPISSTHMDPTVPCLRACERAKRTAMLGFRVSNVSAPSEDSSS
jgi:translation elongation factor EF-G